MLVDGAVKEVLENIGSRDPIDIIISLQKLNGAISEATGSLLFLNIQEIELIRECLSRVSALVQKKQDQWSKLSHGSLEYEIRIIRERIDRLARVSSSFFETFRDVHVQIDNIHPKPVK